MYYGIVKTVNGLISKINDHQGCQNKPVTGAFHRLFGILHRLLRMLVCLALERDIGEIKRLKISLI